MLQHRFTLIRSKLGFNSASCARSAWISGRRNIILPEGQEAPLAGPGVIYAPRRKMRTATRRDTLRVAFRSDKSPVVSKFAATARIIQRGYRFGRKTCLRALPHMEFLCSLEISVGPRLLAHGLEQTVIRGNWDNPIYERERHIFSVCILIMYDFRGLLLSLSLFLSRNDLRTL